jgi:hypothetical protein
MRNTAFIIRTYSFSCGVVAGHVNRLKFLRRSMYAQANFDLSWLHVSRHRNVHEPNGQVSRKCRERFSPHCASHSACCASVRGSILSGVLIRESFVGRACQRTRILYCFSSLTIHSTVLSSYQIGWSAHSGSLPIFHLRSVPMRSTLSWSQVEEV